MKFALLGADNDALDLARAAAASPGHDLVWTHDLGPAALEARSLAPGARYGEDWEALLTGSVADVVIVARGEADPRSEQLRKLVQAGVPLLLCHPAHDSMLLYYELDMIRRESRCVMLPYAPEARHPAIERLAAEIGDAGPPSAEIEQLVFERRMADRRKSAVLRQFARDVLLIRRLCGELNKVSAMAPPSEAARYSNLGVQLTGQSGALVRWSVGPVEETAGARITLIGPEGKRVLHMPESGPVREETFTAAGMQSEVFSDWNPAAAGLENMAAALAGERVMPDWMDACRSVELAEAVERSLLKGRTVELHFEDYTEHATFKGTMTSVGCALLALGLVSLVVSAVAAKLVWREIGYWPYALLAIFGIFLLLQLFKLVFPSERSDETPLETKP